MGKVNGKKRPRFMAGFIKLELFFGIGRRFCHSKPSLLPPAVNGVYLGFVESIVSYR